MSKIPLAIRQQVSMREFTTLELGGPASHFLEAHDTNEIVMALEWADRHSVAVTPLGGGSNMVVADQGIPGLVLRLANRGIRRQAVAGGEIWDIAAGENWDELVAAAVAADLGGIECLSGIPGSCGAAPIQNIGAYGQEISETLVEVDVLDISTGEAKVLAADELELTYRHSRLKAEAGRWIVTAMKLRLQSGRPPALRYPGLEAEVRAQGRATLASCRSAVLNLRRSKSMVYDPADPNHRSVGSFFLNPILSESDFRKLEETARNHSVAVPQSGIPNFPAQPGYRKVPAAWLIENSGFSKGTTEGGIGLSSQHALALIHTGGGRTEDLLRFARKICQRVREQFGIQLQAEPVLLGFAGNPLAAGKPGSLAE